MVWVCAGFNPKAAEELEHKAAVEKAAAAVKETQPATSAAPAPAPAPAKPKKKSKCTLL